MDELIGKFVRDEQTGDIGQIMELRPGKWRKKTYYLIKWIHMEDKSWHKGTAIRKEYFAQYTPESIIEPNGRFEILTGSEALFYVL